MTIVSNGKQFEIIVGPVGNYCIIVDDSEQHLVCIEGWPDGVIPVIRPLSLHIKPAIKAGELSFTAPQNARLSIEMDGDTKNPLLLFFCGTNGPSLKQATCVFERGVHEVDEIVLKSGDRLFLREGAVVRGTVRAANAENISVAGPGVFDVTGLPLREKRRRVMMFQSCRGVTLEDFTVVGSETWNVVPAACQNVKIKGVNVMSCIMSGDGIDLCGCEDVLVEGCFCRVADDCIAIKATSNDFMDGCRDIKNIRVRRCVLWNDEPGNALEIGYETRADEICDIEFSDCDVIHCMREGWQSGGVFTIHNGDRANIHHVTYRDIRVEDAREKLIDLKILYAKYSKDGKRGQIRDIEFSDIDLVGSDFPPSIMRGWEDGEHIIGPVYIRNLTYKGERMAGLLKARIVAEMCRDVIVV